MTMSNAEICADYEKAGRPAPAKETATRRSILAAAERCVCGERDREYGDPENNFALIANLWTDYLHGRGYAVDDLLPYDVAATMCLLKIARIATGHGKADSWVDLAGYAACGGECQAKRQPEG